MAARQKGAFTMSTNLLKLTALICMLIDHIGEFIPQSPIWFRYIGRISAPLFFIAVPGASIIHTTGNNI